jgi:hypothetical protein
MRGARRRRTPWCQGAPLFVVALAMLAVGGCRGRLHVPSELHGDRLLTAPTASYLRTRLALVEAGRFDEARDLWAMRSLLASPPPADDSAERYWWGQLTAAIERWQRGRRDARACVDLALVLDNARWHAEALVMARRGLALDPDLESARRQEHALARLDRFVREADSTATVLRALHAAGDVDAREVPRTIGALAGSFGFTSESLRSRGLYLGQREPVTRDASWSVELSVIVDQRGAVLVRRGDDAVRIRRVIVDDDRLAPATPPPGSPWLAEPGLSGKGDQLTVFHARQPYRRTGMWLYAALEHRAGAAPRRLAELGPSIVATAPGAGGTARAADGRTGTAARDAGTAASAAALPADFGSREAAASGAAAVPDWIAELAAQGLGDALRLSATAGLFARLRAAADDRASSRRLFIRELMELRMEHAELRAARTYLDERSGDLPPGPQRREERRHLEALEHGPLPRWELADLLEIAVSDDLPLERGTAARAILRYLRRTLELDAGAGGDAWLSMDPERLRAAARAIAADRSGGG